MLRMAKIQCDKCNKEFSTKSGYASHQKRKYPCDGTKYNRKIVLHDTNAIRVDTTDVCNEKNKKPISIKESETKFESESSMKDIRTFKDLYIFLQQYEDISIISWLQDNSWHGKDKQESLLRLFGGLNLIEKLRNYTVCKGNFNLKTIQKHTSFKDVFYNEDKNEFVFLNDKGDSSDLTCISNHSDKHLLVTTSKNLNKTNIGNLDVSDIITNFQQYKDEGGYSMTLCICIRDCNDFKAMIKRVEKSSKKLKTVVENEDNIVIDWKDLDQAYKEFKKIFGNKTFEGDIMKNKNRNVLSLKMHQALCVSKTINIIKQNRDKTILWGHIPRSGKSYIMGGTILEDGKDKPECNYMIMTTAPKETIANIRNDVFGCFQFEEFNIVVLDGKNKNPKLNKKNIIICSKQFLQTKSDMEKEKENVNIKVKNIPWLKKLIFDIRFVDESHNGGTTELAQKTLAFYGGNAFTVQITGTYSKPIHNYNIPKQNCILWDIEDVRLCKNIKAEGSIDKLVQKHGEEIRAILSNFSADNIITEYSKYPELWLLTDEITPETVADIIEKTKDTFYGWSSDACFLLKQSVTGGNGKISYKSEFQNPEENLKVWYRIFGKRDKYGIPDKEYPDNQVFLKRIENICKNPDIDSRFISEGEFKNEPMIIMAFLPQNNINLISEATIKILQENNVIPDYDIIHINSKTTTDPVQTIEDGRTKARNGGKKGVLVLSGKQCSLGVSISNCDIVLLLNNSMSFDMIYQMMFRSMTEGKNKKCGFVIDLNIHRVIELSLINYASIIKSDEHPRDGLKYILKERLINLNGDHWMPSFGNSSLTIDKLCNSSYEIYASNIENTVNHLLSRLSFKDVLLTNEEQTLFNVIFTTITPTKKQFEIIEQFINDETKNEKETEMKKGIEVIPGDTSSTDENDSTSSSDDDDDCTDEEHDDIKDTVADVVDKKINFMDIVKHIIPLIILFTIHDTCSSFMEMFELIENDSSVFNILINQTQAWWGKNVNSKIIKTFVSVYARYLKDDKETNMIIRTVKELFVKNVRNSRELSKLIDKYLIPQELEKKANAEVSTPYALRKEMLDKIPGDFWKTPKKVFEPCSGKGGFVIDIVDRFFEGLKVMIPDNLMRYKKIVEECLYFSDINPTNIFICKLLLDPYNEYKLKYNEGNTLDLDVKEKWGLDKGFDAVIGNPPYEEQGKTGDNKLYLQFAKFSIHALVNGGLLLFITPTTIIDYMITMDKNRVYFEKLYDIRYIALNTPKKYFNVNSTFTYFLLLKQNYTNYTEIEHMSGIDKITLEKGMILPNRPSKLDLEIIKKITSKTNNYEIKTCKFSNKSQRIRKEHIKNGIVSEIESNTHKYKIYDTINITNPTGKYYYYDKLDNDFNKKRIILSNKGYLMPFIQKEKNITYSDNFSYILYEDNLCSLLQSNILKYLIFQFSKNGFDKINCVKMLKKHKLTTDIYNDFGLTKEEIKYIENGINN
jgi:hypothetical protein